MVGLAACTESRLSLEKGMSPKELRNTTIVTVYTASVCGLALWSFSWPLGSISRDLLVARSSQMDFPGLVSATNTGITPRTLLSLFMTSITINSKCYSLPIMTHKSFSLILFFYQYFYPTFLSQDGLQM